jgi:hypothetical protein
MDATAWKGETYGARVGNKNRDQLFKPAWTHVEIEIEGQNHVLKLSRGFWNKCPEVRGKPIKEWLFKHHLAPWPDGKPPRLSLTPLGSNRFRLSSGDW